MYSDYKLLPQQHIYSHQHAVHTLDILFGEEKVKKI